MGPDRRGPGGEAGRHLRAGRRAQPAGRAGDPLPGRHQPASTASLSGEFWGASCDADEHEEGGLFSKTVLPRAVLAKAHMPDLAKVVPDLQRRVGRGRRAGRAARAAAARSSSSRSTSTIASWRPCPPTTTRSRCASCSAPASSTGRPRSDNEVDFGITDRQLYFRWRLADRTRRGLRRGARYRRAGCSRGCATRWRSRASTPTCPAPGTRASNRSRTPSREPGGVASRSCRTASGGS